MIDLELLYGDRKADNDGDSSKNLKTSFDNILIWNIAGVKMLGVIKAHISLGQNALGCPRGRSTVKHIDSLQK